MIQPNNLFSQTALHQEDAFLGHFDCSSLKRKFHFEGDEYDACNGNDDDDDDYIYTTPTKLTSTFCKPMLCPSISISSSKTDGEGDGEEEGEGDVEPKKKRKPKTIIPTDQIVPQSTKFIQTYSDLPNKTDVSKIIYQKQYHEKFREEYLNYQKEYNIKNREKKKKRLQERQQQMLQEIGTDDVYCECSRRIKIWSLKYHRSTEIHTRLMNKSPLVKKIKEFRQKISSMRKIISSDGCVFYVDTIVVAAPEAATVSVEPTNSFEEEEDNDAEYDEPLDPELQLELAKELEFDLLEMEEYDSYEDDRETVLHYF